MLRDYEREEISLAEKYLSQQDGVIEVGAGLGYVSSFCMKKLHISNYTIVEANKSLITQIQANHILNNLQPEESRIYNYVLSKKDGETVDFYVADNFWSSSTYTRKSKGEFIKLPTITIPRLLSEAAQKPNVLIMDIEGGEVDIDLTSFLLFEKIIIELHPNIVGGKKVGSLITKLILNGFKLVDGHNDVFFFQKRAPE